MAHQATSDAYVELAPRCLLQRPELAALLGVIASEWAALESNLTFLYGSLLGKTMPHDHTNGPPVHPIGIQIFETLESQHKRITLIEKLTNTLVKDVALLSELTAVVQSIKAAGKQRNKFLHANWGTNDTQYPDAILKINAPGQFDVYEKSDFNEAIDLIITTADAIIKFEFNVIKYFRTTPQLI